MTPANFDRHLLWAAGLVALLLLAAAVTVQNTRRLNEDAGWVAHTYEVIDHLDEVGSRLRDAEVSQRTYLLTGGEQLPADFAASVAAAERHLENVRASTQDNQDQQARIPALKKDVQELAAFWTQTMRVRQEKGLEAAQRIVAGGQSRAMMAELQGHLQQLIDAERSLLRDRSAQRQRTYRLALTMELLSGAASILGVVAFVVLLHRHLAARTAAGLVIAEQAERLRTTLASIGDAVITTDMDGRVTNMNAVAERLTGWTTADALRQPLDAVFRIVNEETRQVVENPAQRALREGVIVGLANHTVLIARDGTERPIDDSAAPIRCKEGILVGCVLVFRDVSSRRQLEKANAERMAGTRFLAAIVESSEDAIISKTLAGIIQSWNKAAERLFGYAAADAIGRHISLLIPPERLAEEDRIIASLKAGQRIEHYETVRRRSDGRAIMVSLTISPIRDEAGQVVGASKIARDITAQRQAAERERHLLAEAATANAKFRAIFDQGTLFAGIIDVDGTLIEANRLSWEGCGYTKEQATGMPFWEGPWWKPSAELSGRIQAAKAQAAAGDMFRAELPYYVADGSARIVDATILPIKDETGRVVFLAATGTDITERKRAEADRQKFVTLVESSTDFIGMCDLQGVPFFVNQAGLQLVGLDSIAQARRTPVREFFFPEDQAKIVEEFFPSVLAQGHGEIEIRFRHFQTGKALWMSYKVLVLADDTGQRIGFATVSQDVTQRRQLEDELRELAANLSDADRRKDEFLATLAHELRNPLAPIRNALQIIHLSTERDTTERARALMERQVEQMVRLVDDLMDVSRITRGKLELRRNRVSLAEVVNSAVETSRPGIDHMGHDLVVALPEEPILLDADLTRLAQVFSNLLNNSAKYMDRGGRIWLSAERQGNTVVVAVKDAGIGISADHLSHIFDMFSQVDRSLERSQGGLGIGLTLVKRLVEMHGGSIEASSAGPGQGAEFTVRLPIAVDAHRSEGANGVPDAAPPRATRSILIVDDNKDGANSLAMLLRLMGNETRTAYDGEEGMAAATAFRPTTVLLDIGLPKLNGYEVCRRLREQAWAKDVVIIAVTGWGQEEDRRLSQQAGFDHHMVKPVDPQELMKLLDGLQKQGQG